MMAWDSAVAFSFIWAFHQASFPLLQHSVAITQGCGGYRKRDGEIQEQR